MNTSIMGAALVRNAPASAREPNIGELYMNYQHGQEPPQAPEPIRDIQRQMGCLRKEVEALQSSIHDLLVRLDPVLGPESNVAAGEGLPQASTPLGLQLQEVESIAYHTRLAVCFALERLQLP